MSAVLLLHGLGGSSAVWGPVIECIGGDVRVAAPELRGSGSIAEVAEALEDQLPPAGAVVVGHSMGGLVATALAERWPERVSRLVLVSTTPTRASRISARSPIERMLRVPALGPLLWAAATPGRLRAGLRTAVAPGATVPPLLVDALAQTQYRTFIGATKAIDDYLAERPLGERLAELHQSVAFMFGTDDQRVRPSAYRSLQSVKGLKLIQLDGVGHTPPLERPPTVAATINQVAGDAQR